MAERMAFILDGRDQLSPVFRRIGESAEDFHRRINDSVDASGGELRAFTRGAGGHLQELGGSLAAAGRAAEAMAERASEAAPEVAAIGEAAEEARESVAQFTRDSAGRIRDLRGRYVSAAVAAEHLARASAEASPEVRTVAVAAAAASESTSRLDGTARRTTPRLTQLGSAASDAAVQVGSKGGGLGGAMGGVAAIAGLSLLPALGALVPMLAGAGLAAVTMKLGFSGVGDAVAAAGKGKKEYAAALKALPAPAREFTKQLVATKKEFAGLSGEIQKVMLPGFTQALKESSPIIKIVGAGMTEMGKGFGDAAAGAGRLMKDSGFQKDFTTVLQLGNVFVRDLTHGLGGLARGFLDFGAKSEPTLRSLSGGISDLLGKGLPGMFQGLERGIDGSSKFLAGFFTMINGILPAIGRFAGEVARTFGPFLGDQMTLFGKVATTALDGLGLAARLLAPVFRDLSFGLKAAMQVGELLAPAFRGAGRAIIEAFLPSLQGIRGAQGPLQQLKGWVDENKIGIMEFGRMAAGAIIGFVQAGVSYLPHLVSAFRGMSMLFLGAFDVILYGASKAFGWIPGIGDKLREASAGFTTFKGQFISGLQQAENKTAQFSATVGPRLAQNRLKMDISSWQSQISVAKGQLASVPPEKRAALQANITDLQNKVNQARRDLKNIPDETVYVTVRSTGYRTNPRPGGQSNAAGGLIRGPGTGTSDSIASWLSNGEYVIRAAAVGRIGVAALDAINSGRPLPPTASGVSGLRSQPAVRAAGAAVIHHHSITVNGALDPVAVAQQLERLLAKLQRTYGLQTGVLAR